MKVFLRKSLFIVATILFSSIVCALPSKDPLPSWNNNAVKQSIVAFVQEVTNKNNPNYVEPKNRIAAFDNDGTLWLEQPMYPEAIFSFDRIKVLAKEHPEWKNKKPFSILLQEDTKALANLSYPDMVTLFAVSHSGMTVDDFQKDVSNWLMQATDPRFHRHYTSLTYQPMIEVMQYLRANDFRVYIVTGGGQDFVRTFSQTTYGVASDEVIGTAGKTKYSYQNKHPVLMKMPAFLFINDQAGKPEAINLFLGKRPIIAFGNSDGDRQMLEWTQSGKGKRLMLLVHHDDAVREYAYGADSKVGTFSHALMNEANQNHWKIISMKHDWKVIFSTPR